MIRSEESRPRYSIILFSHKNDFDESFILRPKVEFPRIKVTMGFFKIHLGTDKINAYSEPNATNRLIFSRRPIHNEYKGKKNKTINLATQPFPSLNGKSATSL
jgi:hypothetical protein